MSDEDVHGGIIRGLKKQEPELDIVRVQDVGLAQTLDEAILKWAAEHDRIVLTQDVNTMVGSAWRRVRVGEPMLGVIAVHSNVSIGRAIEDILTVAKCAPSDEMKNQVKYIPL